MNHMEDRLLLCFKSALPDLSLAEILEASPDSVQGWDSVTTVTLFAIIEEEFGISVDIDDVASNYSFQGILDCIKSRQ